MPGWLSRREFLAAANAAAFLLLVESCSLGPIGRKTTGATPVGAVTGTPFEQALKLLRDAVRASPGHLAQRAADAVASRDASRIVELVRDRVAVLPPPFAGDEPRYARWWGSAATLRGGQGTLRDRADLLADMLTRAGFPARVGSARRPSSIGLGELYAPRGVAFAADRSRIEAATAILKTQGIAPATPPPALPPTPDAAAAILAALPAPLQKARLRADLLPDNVPVVTFQEGGKPRYAFALGSLAITEAAPAGLQTVNDADPTRKVRITVSAVSSPAPGSKTPAGRAVDLVTGEWPADQVVGRQVLLTFMPPLGARAILGSSLDQQTVRIPVLRVQTGDATAPAPVAGSLVTLHGDVLGPSAGGAAPSPQATIDGPYGPIALPSDAERTAAIGRASAIKPAVNAAAFPEIELNVAVNDGAGHLVEGLDAKAFAIKEGGVAVDGVTVYSNARTQQRPRVLIVYDAYPGAWKSAAAESTFLAGLAKGLADAAAATPFDVQVMPFGAAPVASAWAAPDANAIVTACRAASEAADDPWRTVGGAALDQGVSAIILVSDNQATDTDPVQAPTLRNRLVSSHVPVFAVPIGTIDEAATAQVVSLSGGARVDAADPSTPARLVSLLKPYLAGWSGGAYRIRYRARTDGPSRRAVSVGLAGRAQPVGSASYEVPAAPVPPPAFSGLYVTISHGATATAYRRIAGLEIDPAGVALGTLDDPTAVAETRGAINGLTTIAIEPGTTTAAALLDDMLSSCLSIEPVRAIWGTGFTADQLVKAVGAGARRFPGVLVSMLQPVHVDAGAAPTLRVAILQERPAGASAEIHGDFAVGANLVVPVAADAHAGFRAAVITSVGASAAEAATFADSGFKRLSGVHLNAIASGDDAAWNSYLAGVPPGRLAGWRAIVRDYAAFHALVPDAGAVDACWLVDPGTGGVKAVMLDTTGGGAILMACHLAPVDQFALTLAMLAIMCGTPAALAAFPFFCIGINTAAAVMCVVQLATHTADAGTPFSLLLAFYNPLPVGLSVGVGVMLLLISYQAAKCE